MPFDAILTGLILEGETLLNRADAIAADKTPDDHLSIREFCQWEMDVSAWAQASGAAVPAKGHHLDFAVGWEQPTRAYTSRVLSMLRAYAKEQHMPPAPRSRTILFLAADPTDQTRLRLGQEHRDIDERLRLARYRDSFEITERLSVRTTDISQALLDERPHIVHFCGHGSSSGALIFEDPEGRAKSVSAKLLGDLFSLFRNTLECVVLNACFSAVQAAAISQAIPYVIGMSNAISDRAAMTFAVGFYKALGGGLNYADSFKAGVLEMQINGSSESDTPTMLKRDS